MAIIKDFEVRIKDTATGKYLEEYDNPNAPPAVGSLKVETYIEAQDEAAFSVEVILGPEFEFYDADGLLLNLKMDDCGLIDQKQNIWWKHLIPNSNGHLVYSKGTATIKSDDVYKRVNFAFGRIHISKARNIFFPLLVTNLYTDEELEEDQAETDSKPMNKAKSASKYGASASKRGKNQRCLITSINRTD